MYISFDRTFKHFIIQIIPRLLVFKTLFGYICNALLYCKGQDLTPVAVLSI